MPSWKIHLLFDLILVVIFLNFLYTLGVIDDTILVIFLVLFNILATVFPDIDTPKSNIRKFVSLILAVIVTGYSVINFSLNSVLSAIASFVLIYLFIRFFPTKHRGITHTIWFSLVFSCGITSILWLIFKLSLIQFGFCFLVILWGYLSHLILDQVTKS